MCSRGKKAPQLACVFKMERTTSADRVRVDAVLRGVPEDEEEQEEDDKDEGGEDEDEGEGYSE
jgi:hypothetical protein